MIGPSSRRRWPKAPMTVCIAAAANNGERLVIACDTRVSTDVASLDPPVTRKLTGIHGWTALTSGTLHHAENLLDAIIVGMDAATDNNPPTVRSVLETSIGSELGRYAAAQYLAPFGLDMRTFLQSGRDMFTEEMRTQLARNILDYSDRYDVELIVCGWGAWQEQQGTVPGWHPDANIYCVSRDGVAPHTDEGFYACGAGKQSAHSILSYFHCQPHMDLPDVAFYVAAAKFMSERTEGVGPNTLMRVCERLGEGEWRGYSLQQEDIQEFRRMWERSGSPRMPRQGRQRINAILSARRSQH